MNSAHKITYESVAKIGVHESSERTKENHGYLRNKPQFFMPKFFLASPNNQQALS